MDTTEDFDWRRSGRCESGNCVEVARINGEYAVRDSKLSSGPQLRFSAEEWSAFIGAVRDGEFD